MKYFTLFILLMAFSLIFTGCAKKELNTDVPADTLASGIDAGTSEILSPDIALDNPEDPGTLDDLPVSEEIPQ